MRDEGTISDIEQALIEIWSQPRVTPSFVYMPMGGIRRATWSDDDQEVKQFISDHAHLSDEAIIYLSPFGIAIYESDEQIAAFHKNVEKVKNFK